MADVRDTHRPVATALAALVASDLDVADLLAHLVADCADLTGAGAVALLATDEEGDLALLAATSHRASEIEMLQVQHRAGPCVDAITSGSPVRVAGGQALTDRWGEVGQAIVDAGFEAVEAYPMRWHGVSLGGLNMFREIDAPPAPDGLGQAAADVATLAVVASLDFATTHVAARVQFALAARQVVEQAKGVIAYRDDLDMEAAYARLLERSDSSEGGGSSLTQVALDVVRGRGRKRP